MKIEKRLLPPEYSGLAAKYGAIEALCITGAGLRTEQEADEYLGLTNKDLRPAEEMIPKVKEAADLIIEAYLTARPIVIFGDYDCDGVTASAIMAHTLLTMGANPTVLLPSRDEGYGLKMSDVDKMPDGALLITVDCGIKSGKEVEAAKAKGMSVIITDHHLAETVSLPNADVIIDLHWCPNQYGDIFLTGAGVAFELSRYLLAEMGENDPDMCVDLAAVGTIGDVETIGRGENRKIVKLGLEAINRPWGGCYGLGRMTAEKRPLTAEDIAFQVAPVVNACGRLEHGGAYKPFELFMSSAPDTEALVATVKTANNQRKAIQAAKTALAEKEAEKYKDDKVLVVLVPDTGAGIVGLIAGNLKETYHRPAIVFTNKDEKILVASARSIDGYNIVGEFDKVKDLFISYGGHAQAAGCSIAADKLDELRKALNANCTLTDAETEPKLVYDAELSVEECLKPDTLKSLEKCEPFGSGNPKPIIKVHVKTNPIKNAAYATLGDKGQHLLLNIGEGMKAIGFGLTKRYVDLNCPYEMDLYGTLSRDTFSKEGGIVFQFSHIEADNPKQSDLMTDLMALLNF